MFMLTWFLKNKFSKNFFEGNGNLLRLHLLIIFHFQNPLFFAIDLLEFDHSIILK